MMVVSPVMRLLENPSRISVFHQYYRKRLSAVKEFILLEIRRRQASLEMLRHEGSSPKHEREQCKSQ
jgi:hypothetical protein